MCSAVRLLLLVAVGVTLRADEPTGFAIWKASDLKSQAAAKDLSETAEFRTLLVNLAGDGGVEVHESEVELLVVASGEATLVIGGKIHLGTIDGGEKRAVAEGDIVHIPAGLPHQLLVAPGKRVMYLAIKNREDSDEDASSAAAPADPSIKPAIGVDLGAGYRACLASDKAPSGTLADGYRKVVGKSFMGRTCLWERVKSPEEIAAESDAPKVKPKIGTDMGDGFRACVSGDESPSGTVADGYRKVSHESPFGRSCAWEKIK